MRLSATSAAALLAATLAMQPAQAQHLSNERIGNLLGGIAGGVLGAQLGGGSGRIAGAAIGAVGGVLVGGAVGKSLDERDRPAASNRTDAQRPVDRVDAVLVANRNANVRSGPGLDAAVIDRLQRGDAVRRLGRSADGDWLLVDIDGRRAGYVHAPLLQPATADYAG